MWVTGQAGQKDRSKCGAITTQEKLDRALVAGLILEVILDQGDLPANFQARQRLVKTRIQDSLVQHLAGQVSLDRFRTLAQNLDGWFEFYYPLLVAAEPSSEAKSGTVNYCAREPQAAYRLHEPKDEWQSGVLKPPPTPLSRSIRPVVTGSWMIGSRRPKPISRTVPTAS